MSLRTVLRLVLAALLVVTLVGPAAAQVAEAPMPREKTRHGEIRLGLQIGGPQVIQVVYEVKFYGEPAIAPMPREVPVQPYIVVPPLGPFVQSLNFDFPLNKGPFDKGQTFSFSVGLFGGPDEAPMPAPPHCAFDRCAPPAAQMAQPYPQRYDVTRQTAINPLPPQWTNGTPVAQRLAASNGANFTWHYNPPMPRAIVEVIGAENPAYPPGMWSDQPVLIPAYPHGAYRATCNQPSPITGCKPAGDIVVYEVQNCDPRFRTMTLSQAVPLPRMIVKVIGDFETPAKRRSMELGYFTELGYFNDEDPLFAIFRPAPAMVPARPLPAPAHPLVGFRTVRCDGNECWWVEPVRLPMPRTMTHAQEFTCYGPGQIQFVEVRGHQNGVMVGGPAAPCCQIPATKADCCPVPTTTHPVVLRQLGMQQAQPTLMKCTAETWYRDLDGLVFSAAFAGDEMKVCITQDAEGFSLCVTLTAEYAVTKEGLVHGVITGVDVDVKRDPRAPGAGLNPGELFDVANELRKFVDSPFSFRVKKTSSGMMVTNMKVAGEGVNADNLAMACGMYKLAADGQVPAAKPMKTIGSLTGRKSPKCEVSDYPAYSTPIADPGITPPQAPGAGMPQPTPPGEVVPVKDMSEQVRKILGLEACQGGMTLPSPRYLQHYPEVFVPDPQHPLPRELARQEVPAAYLPYAVPKPTTAPQAWSPPKPANVPASEFGMMADVFGQMVGQSGGRCVAPPVQACPVQPAGMMLPAPSAMPMPVASSTPFSPMVGTWYREVGPRLCVVKIDQDHLTLSFTESEEVENGKTAASGVTVTCDYHLSRDGVTAVGLITSVDALVEGDLPADAARELLGFVAAFQKACEEKPFALTLRPYGDSLVVGNVRMPELRDDAGIQPSSMFGGRYKRAGDKPLPKPMKELMHGTPRLPASTSGKTGPVTPIGSGVAYPTPTRAPAMPAAGTSSTTTPVPLQR